MAFAVYLKCINIEHVFNNTPAKCKVEVINRSQDRQTETDRDRQADRQTDRFLAL